MALGNKRNDTNKKTIKTGKMKRKIFASIFFIAAAFVNAAEESVEAEGFSPSTVRPGDSASYRIELKNISPSINISQIPIPKGLHYIGQSQSQSMSVEMGSGFSMQTNRTVSLILSFTSDTEGEYTIPEWKISHEGKEYVIPASSLKVDKNAPQQNRMRSNPFGLRQSTAQRLQRQAQKQTQAHSQEDSPDFENLIKEKITLSLELPRESIFVGETVPCELVFIFDREIQERGFRLTHLFPKSEKIDDFECPGFELEKPVIDYSSNPDKVTIRFKSAITPIKAGSYELDFRANGIFVRELSLDEMMGMSFFMGRNEQIPFELQMDAKKIEVKELPEDGKPENFSGAIGNFKLDSSKLDPEVLTVDEPCTITLKISGNGNFTRMQSPVFEKSENWKTYKFKSNFIDESRGTQNRGVKTFEASLVPLKADITNTPKLEFSYFDPNSEKYMSLEIPVSEVSVAPSASAKKRRPSEKSEDGGNPKDPREIVDAPQNSGYAEIISTPLFWILQAAILCLFAIFFISRRKKMRLLQDPAFAKKVSSKTAAKRELKKALSCAATKDAKEFFKHSRSALQWLLSAKTEHRSAALLQREAENILRDLNRPDLIAEISVFFEGNDALEFGSLEKDSINFESLSEKLSKICKEIENENLR